MQTILWDNFVLKADIGYRKCILRCEELDHVYRLKGMISKRGKLME